MGRPTTPPRRAQALGDLVKEYLNAGTLKELLEHRASSSPDQLAFRFLNNGETEGASVTYRELLLQAESFAARAATRHEPGSRALIMCPSGIDYVVALFGCFHAGIIPVPVYPPSTLLPGRAIGRVLAVAADARATMAVTIRRLEELANSPEMGDLAVDWLLVDAGTPATPGSASPAATPTVGKVAGPDDPGPDDVALVQYTSGSTGTPKGVVLTHRQILSQLKMITDTFLPETGADGVSWLPPYHDMGLIGCLLTPLRIGGAMTLMAPNAFLRRPVRWLEAISRYRATYSPAPNFAYDECVRRCDAADLTGLDLSSWTVAINGAEPVRPATLERFYRTFSPFGLQRHSLWPSYGMAETTLLISAGSVGQTARVLRLDRGALGAGRAEQVKPGAAPASWTEVVTCGPPAPGTVVVAVDPATCRPEDDGRIGELWVSGPHVASGYWDRPEESAELFEAHLAGVPQRSFLRTGDLGAVIDGEIVVTGRSKDVVIIRGVNYYPHDIEDTMQAAHPQLRPDYAAAFSVPGTETELLVLVQGTDARHDDHDGLAEAAHQIVEAVTRDHSLRPDVIMLVAPKHVPRTSSGKIKRSAAREAYLSGSLPSLYEWRAVSTATTSPG
jgi:acyl-CoA synthetase (AMP-forming)/AMP-acid ligase II